MMTRRRLLWSLGGLAGAGAAYPTVEARWIEVCERPVRLRRRLARPLRVAHLSDFHVCFEVPVSLAERGIELALAARPDLVCLTGDYVTAGRTFDAEGFRRVLAPLASAAPTFACLGNHDGGAWASRRGGGRNSDEVVRLLTGSGVRVLCNRTERVMSGGQELAVVGVGDVWAGQCDGAGAFAYRSQSAEVTILLSHNPDSKVQLASFPWDLMLSGHTHGGQVIVPFLGAPYVPVTDRRFIAGLYDWEGRWLHITRGVGNLFGVRCGCRPEVSVLMLG